MKNGYCVLIVLLFFNTQKSNAQYQWTKQSMTHKTSGLDIAVDNLGNSYVIGNFRNECSFDGFTVGLDKREKNYIVKYDSYGNVIWVRTIKGHSNNKLWGIISDLNNNLYITGSYRHTNNLTILDFGNIQLEGNGSDSGFLAKMDSDGNWIWARSLLADTHPIGQDVRPIVPRVLPNGDIIICGYTDSKVTIGNTIFNTKEPGNKMFLVSYDKNGIFLWFKHGEGFWGENGEDYPFLAFELDNKGNLYLQCDANKVIRYQGAQLEPSTVFGSFVVASFTSKGELRWWHSISSSGPEFLGGLTLDDDSNLYIAAYKSGEVHIGKDNFVNDPNINQWVFKFDNSGNYLSAFGVINGFQGQGIAANGYVNDLIYHPDGYIVAVGSYDPVHSTPILFGDSLGGGGSRAAFIAAFSNKGNFLDVAEISYEKDNSSFSKFIPNTSILHPDGGLLITGSFEDDIEIGNSTLRNESNLNNMFALKVDIPKLLNLSSSSSVSIVPHIKLTVAPIPAYRSISLFFQRKYLVRY